LVFQEKREPSPRCVHTCIFICKFAMQICIIHPSYLLSRDIFSRSTRTNALLQHFTLQIHYSSVQISASKQPNEICVERKFTTDLPFISYHLSVKQTQVFLGSRSDHRPRKWHTRSFFPHSNRKARSSGRAAHGRAGACVSGWELGLHRGQIYGAQVIRSRKEHGSEQRRDARVKIGLTQQEKRAPGVDHRAHPDRIFNEYCKIKKNGGESETRRRRRSRSRSVDHPPHFPRCSSAANSGRARTD
jgi:hypothetical protein